MSRAVKRRYTYTQNNPKSTTPWNGACACRKVFASHEKTTIDSISANLSALSEDELKKLSTSLRSLKEIFSRLK